MPITVHWDDPHQTIVRWDFEGAWTWQDFYQAQAESDALITSVEHTVDVVANVARSPSLPRNPLSRYRQARQSTPRNRGVVVVVGANSFVMSIIQIYNPVFGRKLRDEFLFADTLDDARTLIKQFRQRA